MGKLSANIMSLINKDVIIATSLNDQLHGHIISVDEDCVVLQMSDQKRYLNIAHIVSVVPKGSIS